MAGIDDVLERLLTDSQFARHLAQDPASALAGYELTADDLSLLSSQVSFDPGALSLVEERISKSSMFGLLTSITGGLAGELSPEPQLGPSPHMAPEPHTSSGIGGGGSEVSFKEVDPAPQPSAEGQGTGGGGGAGSEVSFKEVDPGVPPDGDPPGIIIDTSVDNPDYQPGGTRGIIIDTSVDNPDYQPGGTQGIIIDTSVDNPEIK